MNIAKLPARQSASYILTETWCSGKAYPETGNTCLLPTSLKNARMAWERNMERPFSSTDDFWSPEKDSGKLEWDDILQMSRVVFNPKQPETKENAPTPGPAVDQEK